MNNLLHKLSLGQHSISDRKIWFTGTSIGLVFIHLCLTWRLMHRTDQVVLNALFWLAILGTLVNQRPQVASNDRASRFMGLLLLGMLLVKSVPIIQVEAWFVRLFPALAVLCLGLLISGFQLKQHWRAGLLLIPLMMPKGLIEAVAEKMLGQAVQVFTAQLAAFVLHYLGVDATQQNTVITLDHGAVDVLFGCTGVRLLILLLQLALLFLIVFSISWQQRLRLLILAMVIALLFSSLRVAVMAVVVKDPAAFAYWHGGNGSQIFSTGAIVLFGWFCQQALPRV